MILSKKDTYNTPQNNNYSESHNSEDSITQELFGVINTKNKKNWQRLILLLNNPQNEKDCDYLFSFESLKSAE